MQTLQSQADKGSQYWLQTIINSAPDILDREIGLGEIKWLSPLKKNDFAEYSDLDFLRILKLDRLEQELKNFWPNRGSHWDGLGRVTN